MCDLLLSAGIKELRCSVKNIYVNLKKEKKVKASLNKIFEKNMERSSFGKKHHRLYKFWQNFSDFPFCCICYCSSVGRVPFQTHYKHSFFSQYWNQCKALTIMSDQNLKLYVSFSTSSPTSNKTGSFCNVLCQMFFVKWIRNKLFNLTNWNIVHVHNLLAIIRQ